MLQAMYLLLERCQNKYIFQNNKNKSTKNFSVEAPKGLISEIQRHYLMYLRDYFAGALLDSLPYSTKSLDFSNLSLEQISAVQSCALQKKILITESGLSEAQFD